MNTNEIMMLGLGLQAPWKLVSQKLDVVKNPYELQLDVAADRGSSFPCPTCGRMCSAHDFKEKKWRHLNFFQHHCYITAKVPRVKCADHGVLLVKVPWAREGSGFTLLFEQAVLSLAREMPVNSIARITEVNDKRLWRIVFHYVNKAVAQLDLTDLKAVGLDETASKRRHNYVTVFIDMEKGKNPVVFATPGKGKETIKRFTSFMEKQGGAADGIQEVVCDMSPAFLSGIKENFKNGEVTVDWFHIVQKFVNAVDETRKNEHRERRLPKGTRFAVLKGKKALTEVQTAALAQMLEEGTDTSKAWIVKEALNWIRRSTTIEEAEERITEFLKKASELIKGCRFTRSVVDALKTLKNHRNRVVRRWQSTYTNARLEGMNSLFQAARARARGYRNPLTFIAMIYMIGSPVGEIFKST